MSIQNSFTSIQDIPNKSILIFGCGNILFGDDGFGPRVADELIENYHLPESIGVINAGTSIRTMLFDIILNDKKPEKIIIIDAIDAQRSPGEIFEIPIDEIPEKKIDDFSMHQLPTSNLLKELKELCQVEVIVLACQVENIPTEVTTNLSNKIMEAIPAACEIINNHIEYNSGGND
jgi:coenzyme F420 hydrogenase subunit delta